MIEVDPQTPLVVMSDGYMSSASRNDAWTMVGANAFHEVGKAAVLSSVSAVSMWLEGACSRMPPMASTLIATAIRA